ncbi:hypothetical protein N7539_007755 [Penicillium diatomitis]|uniref:Uncharacterized protein n=1 Tax=Penicillium diatomitis TaxID=2819901 RepID=A0A9X0BNK1_9EURO|nr:uncharacterized protein N7539_007755 [Penicillium diatomitis]KAJ5475468.1 hypothetical protein N7539_007755 [Penicillium diatomitis]
MEDTGTMGEAGRSASASGSGSVSVDVNVDVGIEGEEYTGGDCALTGVLAPFGTRMVPLSDWH